ncbi:MAG TPA: D-alanyl-D-alanine carboxypeptidase [Candidatus Alectryocaccomicrobium excrementavium]|uniref:serine-type D-Ala-D-Ala carboxypeptidase n=1 Tax=Candidatus Alectryocaccomicrobium excrementavium TaxID=2840668 RepID=A0A9D1G0K6_9FIRM|nr:D-alanyl-D-alanine carboxypeptidase [Candidatus Alectryocaccomicrobium excrementavium]
MKRFACLFMALALLAPAPAVLAEGALETAPPIPLLCESAVLMEPESGQILFEQNAGERRPVASVTKVMAILLALEALEAGRATLGDPVTISKTAAGMGGSQVLLDAGETQPFEILLKSMIVGSANDATVAIGEYLYGSHQLFVDRMNERAQELGMADTYFVNSTGLPAEGHYTTARDVARMTVEMLKHPLYFDYSTIWLDSVIHESGRETQLTNTNRLIRLYDGCDGGKTGSTSEAGYCLSATAERGGMRLIAVVLGAQSSTARFDTAASMFDYGFANYRLYPVARSGAKIRGEMPVEGGNLPSIALMLQGDLTLLMKKGGEQAVELLPNLPPSVQAPLSMGDLVGSVDVALDGRVIASIDVVAAQSVGRQDFADGLRRVFGRWLFQ